MSPLEKSVIVDLQSRVNALEIRHVQLVRACDVLMTNHDDWESIADTALEAYKAKAAELREK